jgi:LysR family nitrogen assimilation transcriptional regulator
MSNTKSIDLSHLRYFVGIVDAGSLSKAAGRLHIAQPALSNRMAALEQHLGALLLHRSYTGVRPTEAGLVFYATATRILRELDTVAEELSALGQIPSGPVRFGCSLSTSAVLANPLLEAMIETLPKVRFSFVSGPSADIYQRLLRGDLDFALIFKDGEVPGVTSAPLLWEDLFLVVAADDPRFKDMDSYPCADIGRLDFVMPSHTRYFGTENLHSRFRDAGVELHVVAQIDAAEALFSMIVPGKAASIIPWAVCMQRELEGRVRLLPISGIDLSRNLDLCVPADRPPSPAVEASIGLVRRVVRDLIHSGTWKHAAYL